MSRSRNSDKGFILGFRLTVDDEIPIRLPKGERWTLYFTENFLYIGFGKRKNGEYKFNRDAIAKLQNRYVDSELGLWDIENDKAEYKFDEYLREVLLYEEDVSSLSEEEFYDPFNRRFYRESELAERGDCHPIPYRSKESLDEELEEYANERDYQRSSNTYNHKGCRYNELYSSST